MAGYGMLSLGSPWAATAAHQLVPTGKKVLPAIVKRVPCGQHITHCHVTDSPAAQYGMACHTQARLSSTLWLVTCHGIVHIPVLLQKPHLRRWAAMALLPRGCWLQPLHETGVQHASV